MTVIDPPDADQPAPAPSLGRVYGTAIVMPRDGAAATVALRKPVVRVGQAPDNDIVLADDEVSPYQAQIFCRNAGFEIIHIDEGDAATLVDATPLPPYLPLLLTDNSVIQLGRTRIFLYPPDEPFDDAAASPIEKSLAAPPADAPTIQANGAARHGAYGLAVVLGPAGRQDVPINHMVLWVGRASDNDIVIDEPAIDEYHAQLINTPGGFDLITLATGQRAPVDSVVELRSWRIMLYGPAEVAIDPERAEADPPPSAQDAPEAARPIEATLEVTDEPLDGSAPPLLIAVEAVEVAPTAPAESSAVTDQPAPPADPVEAAPVETIVLPPAPADAAPADEPITGATQRLDAAPPSAAEFPPAPADAAPAGEFAGYGTAILRYPDGRTATIALLRPTIRLGRAPSNDVVIDDPAVSEQHAQIFCTSETFYILDLNSEGGTRLDNRRLTPYFMQALAGDSVIQIGEMAIFLYPAAGAGPPGDRPAIARQPPQPAPEPAVARAIGRLALAPANLTLDAGASGEMTVSFVNQSQVLGRISVAVVGLPAPWVQVAEQDVPVFPGSRGEVKITIAPPRDPSSLAGGYSFVVEVRSDHAPGEVWTLQSILIIRPYSQFKLALFPRYQSARRRATYEVEITNRGNSLQTFELHCFDEHNAFAAPFVSRMIWIKPGTSHRASFRLSLKSWRWWIGRRQGYHFIVSARSSDDQIERVKGIFIHVPLITRGTKYPATAASIPAKAQPALPAPDPAAQPAPPSQRQEFAPNPRPARRPRPAASMASPALVAPAQPTIPLETQGVRQADAPAIDKTPDIYQPAHLALTSTSFTIDAGAAATTTLSVINRSTVVDRIELGVVGLPPAWVTIVPESLPLLPNAQAEAQLIISPPRHARSLAETARFRVVARSEKRPDQQVVALATLTIKPFTEFKVDVFPKEQKARRQARYQVQVTNKGNHAQTFQIQGLSEDGALDFTCETPDIVVPPGEIRRAELRARLQQRRIVGSSQIYPFMAGAQPADQPDLVQQVPARMADKPWIPQWFLQMVVLPLFLVAFALAMVYGRSTIANWFRALTSGKPAVTGSAGSNTQAQTGGADLVVTPTIALDSQPAFTVQTPITTELHWTLEDSPKVLRVNTTVPAGTLLVIDPGVEVQLASRVRLIVEGQLVANGSAAAPVTFRTADGGAWDGIYVSAGGVAYLLNSQIEDAGVRNSAVVAQSAALVMRDSAVLNGDGGVYGANSYVELQRVSITANDLANSPAVAVRLAGKNNVVLDTVTIEGNAFAADAAQVHIVVDGAQGTLDIRNNTFADQTRFGMLIEAAAAYSASLTCNAFANSAIGLGLTGRGGAMPDGVKVSLGDNSFQGHSQYGVFSERAIDAANNWWGAAGGPAGAGSKASPQVSAAPWLDAAPACTRSP